MSSPRDTIIQHLRAAQALERGLASQLEGRLRSAPPSPYRSALRRRLDTARRHADQLGDRLTDLGAAPGVLEMGLELVEEVAERAVGVVLAPINLVSGRSSDDELVRDAQTQIGAEARCGAVYDTLERLAAAVGDEATGSLARTLRADCAQAMDAFEEALPQLVDRVVREATGGAGPRMREPEEIEGEEDEEAEDELDTEAQAAVEEGDEDDEDHEQAPKRSGSARAGRSNGGPVVAREETERDPEVVARQSDGIPGPELHVEAPWEGYDGMTARQVLDRLRDADPALVAVVRLYEQTHKQRKAVLRRAEPRTADG